MHFTDLQVVFLFVCLCRPTGLLGFSLIFIASTPETKDLGCASVQQQNIHIFARFCAACLQVLLYYGCFCCKLQPIGVGVGVGGPAERPSFITLR